MTTVLNLILLPLRAPMVLLLLLVSTYLGLHWSQPGSWADVGTSGITDVLWSVECLHSLVVVIVCTMPDLLLRRVSSLMATSRVISLVLTLLMVTIGGIYLLHLEVLSNVLILGSAVLLARLDLLRLRIQPPPFVMTLVLSVLVLGGATTGRSIEGHLRQMLPPASEARPAGVRGDEPGKAPPPSAARAPAIRQPAGDGAGEVIEAPVLPRGTPAREPDRVVPHLQESGPSPAKLP